MVDKAREKRIEKALKHPNVLGAGAAARRKHLKSASEVYETDLKEFERGTLHSGSGQIVTSRKQALAIARSEASRMKKAKHSLGSHINFITGSVSNIENKSKCQEKEVGHQALINQS
jgi:hypothetical protein